MSIIIINKVTEKRHKMVREIKSLKIAVNEKNYNFQYKKKSKNLIPKMKLNLEDLSILRTKKDNTIYIYDSAKFIPYKSILKTFWTKFKIFRTSNPSPLIWRLKWNTSYYVEKNSKWIYRTICKVLWDKVSYCLMFKIFIVV